MGLTFAVDQLYATGWSAGPASSFPLDDLGRPYPTREFVDTTFARMGRCLRLTRSSAFGCVTATWTDDLGGTFAVTGSCEAEAAVYALSRLRRDLTSASVPEPAHA